MRFFFLYLLTSVFYFHTFSQNKKTEEFNFSNFHKKELSIKTSVKKDFEAMIPGNIQVLDWRADSTSIGFRGKDYFTIADIRTAFKNQLLSLIDFKKESNLAEDKVVVCINKLWITQNLMQTNRDWKDEIIWKVNCFKRVKDKFTYLCQLDTIIENNNRRFRASDLIPLCLQLSAEKIKSVLVQPGKPETYLDLQQFKYPFDDIPILNDFQKKKGLYMTYEQFLNNAPSTANFEIKKDKLTDALFVINSSGTYELTRKVWGYCDGENMFIKSGEKYFQLCRVNNTFYFYGAKKIRKSVFNDPGTASLLNLATNTNRKITKYSLPYFAFQLDITDGNFY